MYTLLKGARIYDGTASDPFVGDVLIKDDRIEKVAPSIELPSPSDVKVIDLAGKSVSAGFVDGHSHNDWFAFRPDAVKYFEPFIRQGITTFITGNCGLSATGFDPETKYPEVVGGGLFGYHNPLCGMFPTVESFFERIDRNTPANIAVLVGHCTARAGVVGDVARLLTPEENAKMLSDMELGLKQGACGLSLGLMYVPGKYSDVEELKGVARLCEKYDRPMTVHPRAESAVSMDYPLLGRPHILRAMDELVEVVKGTRTKLQYSHAIFVGRSTFKCKDELHGMIRGLRDQGVDAMYDIYNECLGVSVITVILPAWYQSLSPKEKRSPWNKFRLDILTRATIMLLGFGWKDIVIAYVGEGNEKWEGKTVYEVAKEMGKSCLDAYLDLCEMSDFKGRVNMGPYSTADILSWQMKDDLSLYMTDAWVEDHGIQNPAIYDCFPKFLRDSLLGRGASMPVTIRKMTGATVDRFSIKDRGYLKEGYYADITVFDEKALREGTPDRTSSFGIDKVFINGRLVLDGETLYEDALRTSGRAVRVGV